MITTNSDSRVYELLQVSQPLSKNRTISSANPQSITDFLQFGQSSNVIISFKKDKKHLRIIDLNPR